ncbi:MAG: tetratricopeptide repeat protein [Rhizobiaceae bacterium]|nr:tetratricopeptide repeat protein [Rhizobiaceae bacterium]
MATEQTRRRLAAILAADVVGYSRLMAADEVGTLELLNQHRETCLSPLIARNNGRIVKLMGDGTLVEFNSVVGAVKCAVAIQRASEAEEDDGTGIILRIGINLGDIITQNDDIFGDGVNIAARLEQLAEPGGICVSSVVNESIGSRIEEVFHDGGEVTVKNIDRPLRVFHWRSDDSSPPGKAVQSRTETNDRSDNPAIAVLPFDNMSKDPDQEYFSDGISEDIITDLSKVSGLQVIARNSSFAYKGRSVDLRMVGEELGVNWVLEGSVRRAGERVRITAQLINAATGGHVWADRYDRDLTDIFAVQDEVTFEIVKALKIKLTSREKANITAVETTNLRAHECYMQLRGLLFYPGMDLRIWRQAVAYGHEAIKLDPSYAPAHAVLSMMHLLDYHNGWSDDESQVALDKSKRLIERAMELDPDGMLSNHVFAVHARWTGQLEIAEKSIAKSLAISPDYAMGLFTRGETYVAAGKLQEAIVDLERAIRLDPSYSHQYLQFLAMAHFLQGNFETAIVMLRERILHAKNTDVGRAWLAAALGHIGEFDEARKIWAELLVINPNFCITTRLERLKFADQSYSDRMLEGLTKAGLPPKT